MLDLYKELKKYGKVKTNEPLSKHTSFKIGGPADFFVIVENIKNLVDLLKLLDSEGQEYFVLGGGSNILISDSGFNGVVIKINCQNSEVFDHALVADAGCSTAAIAHQSVKNNLTGFEWGVGVPGTIGGAVRGNAGAMGSEMKDVVSKVEIYKNGEVLELNKSECQFGYRNSVFKTNGDLILRVWLELINSEDKSGMKKALESLNYRQTTQPQGFASTGCIFKNPDFMENEENILRNFDENDEKIQNFKKVGKISAGWLVELADLKGLKIGDAQISEKHGNFVLNLGDAKSTDVLSLIEKIKQEVYNKYGIKLEEEIEIL